jgi:hypothetical protein
VTVTLALTVRGAIGEKTPLGTPLHVGRSGAHAVAGASSLTTVSGCIEIIHARRAGLRLSVDDFLV